MSDENKDDLYAEMLPGLFPKKEEAAHETGEQGPPPMAELYTSPRGPYTMRDLLQNMKAELRRQRMREE